MSDVVEFSLGPDNPEARVFVQVPGGSSSEEKGEGLVGRGEGVIQSAQQSFEVAIERLQPMIDVLAAKLQAVAVGPESVTVEFGITLSAKVGAVIASTDAETNLKVSLTWAGRPDGDA